MGRKRKVEPNDIRYLYEKGYTQVEVGKIVGCSQPYVSKVLKNTKKTEVVNISEIKNITYKKHIRFLYFNKKSWSQKQIAKLVGCSQPYVSQIIKKTKES